MTDLSSLEAELAAIEPVRRGGTVRRVDTGALTLRGLAPRARLGDQVAVTPSQVARGAARDEIRGEIVALDEGVATAMTYGPTDGIGLGDPVWLVRESGLRPCDEWIGRVVDAFGKPLDGRPLPVGPRPAPLRRSPPPATRRRRLGGRLATGLSALDTVLPLARGQRVGVFAGSGVGKSTLLADLARGVEADVVVLALIGERGREVREFIEGVLGEEGMRRSVVIAATSDQSPLVKRRAAWAAMTVAEHFRDEGKHVLLLLDSVTRFAEAHREVALTAGEPPSLRAYPPSTANLIAGLAERAGPGPEETGGDITAVFTVLVAGSDMEEPIADITRGILDGHLVLDRAIAERGRFPAIDLRRSVSRSLPGVADADENALIAQARRMVGVYEEAAPMIQAGLYRAGADPRIDAAIAVYPAIDEFLASRSPQGPAEAFARLARALHPDSPADDGPEDRRAPRRENPAPGG
ncbi:FliI/YscN family ATPase [Oceanicella actignis]|uniref:Flagellum-specific ATP synthase n=1 Tax=Oceanicella actignis TaxID=1189325 RepID=A0A1M7T4E8_9RHOB|nr:FliI/YscN family ATPase [Oceanicella actignis]SET41412.1 flagellum-specific ATP synthase [Oceanicella actignis]SHN65571.1 flagellum-specific ATP synthase [Oceanicella actignis]